MRTALAWPESSRQLHAAKFLGGAGIPRWPHRRSRMVVIEGSGDLQAALGVERQATMKDGGTKIVDPYRCM